MITTILDYLEDIAQRYPDKTAYEDNDRSYTFRDLVTESRKIGSEIARQVPVRSPIVVYMKKGAHNIPAFFGAAYAGCFYVPIDKDMPDERIRLIIDVLKPKAVICDSSTAELTDKNIPGISVIKESDTGSMNIDEARLETLRATIKTTDLLYVLFTSGSTGVPKGVTISHAAVIDFMEWICDRYNLDEHTSLCNQAPFYFDASVPDLYIPLKTGATVYIPPKSYYTFPKKILSYINEKKINTLVWVPSALCNVVNTRAFEVCVPENIKLVIFCGEVMPCKHLNVWKKYVPDALYVNMYGPTEATYACMYYDILRPFSDEESLPLGKACENSSIFLITDEEKEAKEGEIGEICIAGICLSNGYFNNKEKSDEVFTQHPLNDYWFERIYHTGDLAKVDKNGDMVFCGRKDFQIKRLGHRIELGEIENALCSVENIQNACCIFDEESANIIAVYSGNIDENELSKCLSARLMPYMLPSVYVQMPAIPMNLNGKIDRPAIKKMYLGGELT